MPEVKDGVHGWEALPSPPTMLALLLPLRGNAPQALLAPKVAQQPLGSKLASHSTDSQAPDSCQRGAVLGTDEVKASTESSLNTLHTRLVSTESAHPAQCLVSWSLCLFHR